MPIYSIENINDHTLLGLWKIEESDNFDWSAIVHEQDITNSSSINNPKNLKQRLASRALINACFEFLNESYLGTNSLSSGAPLLIGKEKHISISHSHSYAAVIISETEVGIDIQKVTANIPKAVPRICSEKEKACFKTNTELALVWATKEALYKKHSNEELELISQIEITNILKDNISALIKNTSLNGINTYKLIDDYVLVISR